ncbi:MAG: prolyl-tRNA synthetase [Candidatus Tokpelaia sp. JSC161]|jgi:prolyl-tRNA synthetase|nr:MAG: prolyl-tRNA synthetase [Candidatus Tokpelaia sp. JSC161]
MRFLNYFLPVLKASPKEAEISSHSLMLRAALIRQQSSGIYSWLPLGKRVLDKLCKLVREEQNRAGAIEILMPTIQPASLWRESGRYDSYGKEMLRIQDRQNRDMLYGPTNEELVTDIVRSYVRSHKDLPLNLYQIQWKFRDEIRPRFGIMRAREFLMKDAYSFDCDSAGARASYNRMFVAYLRVFARIGLVAIPISADSGPIGGDMSHEFIILSQVGESSVVCDQKYFDMRIPSAEIDFSDKKKIASIVCEWTDPYAATEDMHPEALADLSARNRISARGIEVGHLFSFGTKYSNPMCARFIGIDGKNYPFFMGSYGMGLSRLVGAVVESSHDKKGIIWPKAIAPFDVGIINLKPGDVLCDRFADSCYQQLENAGIDCLLDDRNEQSGSKFATMDLIGLPLQIIIGPRNVLKGEIEIKDRKNNQGEVFSLDAMINRVTAKQ